jgi:putative nucleotide binding protein
MQKEEQAIVLDYLPHGYPMDKRPLHMKTAIAQAIGKNHFVLLELVPKRGQSLQPHEEVYIGEGKRDKIHHILGKITLSKLTETAKSELNFIIKKLVTDNEKKFIDFFNNAQPINLRRHQLELLPGVGKKHMQEILEKREEKAFESFEDIRNRVKLMPDPEKTIIKRILLELEGEKHNIFVN